MGDTCRYGQQILQRGRGGESVGLPDSAAALRVRGDEVSDGAVVLRVDVVGGRTGPARRIYGRDVGLGAPGPGMMRGRVVVYRERNRLVRGGVDGSGDARKRGGR